MELISVLNIPYLTFWLVSICVVMVILSKYCLPVHVSSERFNINADLWDDKNDNKNYNNSKCLM